MATKNAVNPLLMKSIDSATMTSSYQAIDSLGIAKACFLLKIVNASSQAVTVSFNGVDDNDFIPANLPAEYPSQTNAQPNSWVALWEKGTKVYVKGTAGTGRVYVTGLFVER